MGLETFFEISFDSSPPFPYARVYMNIFIGLVCIAVGVAVIVGSYWLEHSILHFSLAEKYLGPGNGTLGYKLVGLGLIGFGVAIAFGILDLGGDTLGNSATPEQTTPTSNPSPPTPTPSSGGNFAQ